MIRNLARVILLGYGYRVLLAEDGLQALEVYQREGGRIDLVVLDLTMPRLSGRDTLRRLAGLDPGVKVLFSSGYSADQVNLAEFPEVLGFVHKPYRSDELAAAVRSALDKARALPAG
jgi:CheY-like chemotaxis protein